MIPYERHKSIIKMVENNGTLSVSDLSRKLSVSEITIRRDLDRLSRDGLLKRTRGGAASIEDNLSDLGFFERRTNNPEKKMAVARAASDFISEGDSLFMDASTTCLALADALAEDCSLSVLTNGLHTALKLSEKPGVTCVMLGGTVRVQNYSTVGPATISDAARYSVDKVFLSARAVDRSLQTYEASELDASIKQTMVERGKEVILLVDSSKLNKVSLIPALNPSRLNVFITDQEAPGKYIRSLRKTGVKTVIAGKLH